MYAVKCVLGFVRATLPGQRTSRKSVVTGLGFTRQKPQRTKELEVSTKKRPHGGRWSLSPRDRVFRGVALVVLELAAQTTEGVKLTDPMSHSA